MTEPVADQQKFLENPLPPVLDAAVAGTGPVFFVDAAHFVYGTHLCGLWSIVRVLVQAASGRQRFNVLGVWNAVPRQLVSVTNTIAVNTETIAGCRDAKTANTPPQLAARIHQFETCETGNQPVKRYGRTRSS